MTEDRQRRERLTEYVLTVRKFHDRDEIRRRFVHRTFDETLIEVGKLADPMLDDQHRLWLGYEILADSIYLNREYLDQDVLARSVL